MHRVGVDRVPLSRPREALRRGGFFLPWQPIAAFAVLANVCSVGLALLPTLLFLIGWVLRVLGLIV